MKSKTLLESFIKYCQEHPDERFWQALRNWAKVAFILMADNELDISKQSEGKLWKNERDTFYMEQSVKNE